MLKKTITYKDYNGAERTENFYFNLTEAEVMEMEMGTTGGMAEMIQRIIDAQDMPSLIKVFKDIVMKAYGEKSPDGKHFMKKGGALAEAFIETEAYSVLFMELVTVEGAAAEFVNGIIPAKAKAANA